MRSAKLLAGCLLATMSMIMVAASITAQSTASAPHSAAKKHSYSPKPAMQQSDGERVFHQNCSRCHNAPQSFSPSISGAIVRHMRIRANLSRQDERAILRFLNP